MYTFGSDEGIAALIERETATDEPWTMTLATWSENGRQEFVVMHLYATEAERALILGSILGGGDETSHERHERVSFVMGSEAFTAMVSALTRASRAGGNDGRVADDMLGTIAETVGVEWV